MNLEITRCLVWYKNKNATIAYIASTIFITSVAAFTISSWPLWIWIFQKKLLNNFNKTQPVNLKEKYKISHHIISFVQIIDTNMLVAVHIQNRNNDIIHDGPKVNWLKILRYSLNNISYRKYNKEILIPHNSEQSVMLGW